MPRLFVSDIEPQMQVDEIYRVADRQLRANRQGNSYLLMQLQDRTGVISAMRWNADERLAERHPKGSFLRIQGASQVHNGILQIIANQLQPIDESQLNMEDFEAIDRVAVEQLWNRALEIIATMTDMTMRLICESFAQSPELRAALCRAPAGIKTHHAYPGGLLEHVVSLMELAILVSGHYPAIDRDLLITGAMLHDIGKIEELTFEGELGYSDAGQMLGHLVQGVSILRDRVRHIETDGVKLDAARVLRLEHIIVSHHGSLEHGSPKVAMTLEAIAFQFLDEMDAKLNTVTGLVKSDRTRDEWTPFFPSIGRKLYKPSFE